MAHSNFCRNLTSITLPQNIKTINGNPFYRWNGKLIVKSDNFIYEDDVLFDKYKQRLIAYRSKNKDYEIPNTITSIEPRAFMGCEEFNSIHIPDSVTSIGDNAFWRCENLTSIHILDSVTSIGKSAFYKCHLLSDSIKQELKSRFGDQIFAWP